MVNYKIIKYRKLWLLISAGMVVVSIAALLIWGLRAGLDFTGGSLLEIKFAGGQPTVTEIQNSLNGIGVSSLVVQPTGSDSIILRFQETSQDKHLAVVEALKKMEVAKSGLTEIRFESIGASVGAELRSKSFWVMFLVLMVIILYISVAFSKVSKPVASWKYGLIAVVALFHDIIITAGIFAILGHYFAVEVNTPFVVALLTVLGYSVHDTIVVFDRTRENLPKSHDSFAETVSHSLNQTFVRSVNTVITVLLSLLAVLVFGGSSIRDFVLALMVGIFCGAYSSLFVASPLLVYFEQWQRRK
ncbi:MAG: protein translocase subunit SecF [Candidatus Falkowbacteria bacterium]